MAVLEPAPDGFLVAIWVAKGATARVIVTLGLDTVAEREVDLREGIGVAEIIGLAPDTEYAVTTRSAVGPIGPSRVRTTPAPADPRPVRIAVSADFDPNPEFDSALIDHVIDAAPDVVVTLGDFPYTDNGPDVAKTVAAYRDRHAALRTSPTGRRLLENSALYAIYDDHEFHNNWNPAFVAAEPDRYAAAMQVWDEMFPIRAPVGDIRYRSWRFGANVEGFLLDCRRFRSANDAPDDAAKVMLGAEQRAWLGAALRASTAAFKLVFTSVPLDFGTDNDSWVAFQTERALLFDLVVGIPGVLFITADQHYFAAHRHAHGIREIMTGPLARGLGTYGPEAPGVLFRYSGYNAGLFDVYPDRIEVSGLGAEGETFYRETLTAGDLTPQ